MHNDLRRPALATTFTDDVTRNAVTFLLRNKGDVLDAFMSLESFRDIVRASRFRSRTEGGYLS